MPGTWAERHIGSQEGRRPVDGVLFLSGRNPGGRPDARNKAQAVLLPLVALEVVQRTLGHASLGTMSICVPPEEARMRREAAKYHMRLSRDT